jgi:hypothetical protein
MGIFGAAAGLAGEAAGVLDFSAGAGADCADAGRQLKTRKIAISRDAATRSRVWEFFKVILHECLRCEAIRASTQKN